MKAVRSLQFTMFFFSCLFLSSNLSTLAQRSKRTDPNAYYRAPSAMSGKTIVIPSGTTFEGRINSTICSAKSHPGVSFSIVLSSPVLANGTDVIIPAGAEILGEVVEAIPASSIPKQKGMAPPRGKLRVQINSLRNPDGITYPLVASLVGDQPQQRGRGGQRQSSMPNNGGVAYIGSSSAFEAVSPGMQKMNRGNGRQGPQIVSKKELLSHEIYGSGASGRSVEGGSQIRSLIVYKRDYWINAGSPLTIKLNAPLKLAVTPQSTGLPVTSQEIPEQQENSLPPQNLNRAPQEAPRESSGTFDGPATNPGRSSNNSSATSDF